MEKRYQVFVSSTYTDLIEERRQVTQALLELECLPAAMEIFVATDDDQWTLIQEVIDLSDYYVLIVGGRYGSTTAEGISYTEKEFNYALEKKKPVLAFVHRNPEDIPQGKTDMSDAAREQLGKFRERVMDGRTVAKFSTAHELGSEVSRALSRMMRRKPGVGWVRGNLAMTVEQEREMLALREQIAALNDEKRAAETALVEDTSGLAQGDERVTVMLFAQTKRSSVSGDQKATVGEAVKTTWDLIFADIAPLLVDEAPESEVENRLKQHLYWIATDGQRGNIHKVPSRELMVNYDEWDRVKTQFRALGLVDKGAKKRPITDANKYLRLTDKGDRHLTRLIAVEQGVDPGAHFPTDDDDAPNEDSLPSDPEQ